MPGATIAPAGAGVKSTRAASQRDTGDKYPRRPDVLSKMPLSCNVVFDVLRSFAMGEAVELSVRELAEMCQLSYEQTRRALRRLQGAKLIRWRNPGPGRGHRSVFEVRWTPPSFPQENDSPHARKSSAVPQGEGSFAEAKTPPASPTPTPPPLKCQSWQPSERAIRWALARVRERLWGLPRQRRERAVGALARAFRWGAAQPRPWTRARWKRFVAATLSRFEEGPDGITEARRRPYGWAMRCAKEALTELGQRDAELAATERLVRQIRQSREAARAAWARLTAASSSAGRGACPAAPPVQPRSLPVGRDRPGVRRAPRCLRGATPPAGPTGPPSRARLPTPARYLQP